jgi:prolyl oligopeptidase
MNDPRRTAVADGVVGDDPYLWLEAVDGEEALDWVERHKRSTCSTPTPASPW